MSRQSKIALFEDILSANPNLVAKIKEAGQEVQTVVSPDEAIRLMRSWTSQKDQPADDAGIE